MGNCNTDNCGKCNEDNKYRIQKQAKDDRTFIRHEDTKYQLVTVVLLQASGKWGTALFDKKTGAYKFGTHDTFEQAREEADNWYYKKRGERFGK